MIGDLWVIICRRLGNRHDFGVFQKFLYQIIIDDLPLVTLIDLFTSEQESIIITQRLVGCFDLHREHFEPPFLS